MASNFSLPYGKAHLSINCSYPPDIFTLREQTANIDPNGFGRRLRAYLNEANLNLDRPAVVVADNILSHDLSDYVRHVRSRPGAESMTLPIGKGLEITRIA